MYVGIYVHANMSILNLRTIEINKMNTESEKQIAWRMFEQ